MQGIVARRALLYTVTLMALAGCREGGAPTGAASGDKRPDREWTDAARVEAIASALQACSYEGTPANVEPGQLNGQAPGDCKTLVDRIMGYTGLPANFVVTAGPVANALAVVLPDKQQVLQRVIAFNPNFISATERVTGGGQWGPVSIMAHEIGHHLSGHTITAGGSRPGLELEADKFSGYVLYKMGAPLADATKAINALGSAVDQPTHPSKARRMDAITQGWQEACRQAGGNCAGATPTPTPTPTPGTTPQPVRVASLPTPSSSAIPFKYGHFVVDETGKLDPAKLEALDQRLYALAQSQGLELALLVVNDLRGMSAEDYAWAMMRQLRVGKLDLGNGGVFVVAPNQNQAAVALAPGIAKQLEFQNPTKRMQDWIGFAWGKCGPSRDFSGSDPCATDLLLGAMDFAIRWADDVTWKIRFNSIEDVQKFSDARLAERRAGRKWDDKIDQSIGSLVRFSGKITNLDPPAEFLKVNEATVKDGRWRPVLVQTDTGKEVTLYMQPQTSKVMPSGALQAGKQYTFTGELKSSGQFHTTGKVIQGNTQLWLFSYEALD